MIPAAEFDGAVAEYVALIAANAPQKISAPELNPRLNPQLVTAIMNYRPSAARSAAGINGANGSNAATGNSGAAGSIGTGVNYASRPKLM